MKKIVCFLFAFLFIFLCLPMTDATAVSSDTILKVGLYYSSDALPTANLANEVGSGYEFGQFDSYGYFDSVGAYTYEEKITVMKDKSIWYGGGTYYDEKPSSYSAQLGAYHVQLDESYSSFEDARRAAEDYSYAFPAYIDGEYRVRVEHFSTYEYAEDYLYNNFSGWGTVVGNSSTCYTVAVTGSENIIFEFDDYSEMGIMPMENGTGKTQTWFKGFQYYGGFQYDRVNGNDITVVNFVETEDYVMGVIPWEMSASWPLEALKAQAICARTYALANADKHRSYGFDVCASTDCQVYRGVYTATYASVVEKAVSSTAGLCAYYQGKLATTYFFSSDGGYTEDAANVWGSDVPYLKAVKDDFEKLTEANKGIWSVTYTADELTWILQNKGYNCSDIVSCYVKSLTDAGNVYEVVFVDDRGVEWSFTKGATRTIFYSSTLGKEVNSIRYTINGGSGDTPISMVVNPEKQTINSRRGLYVIDGDGETMTFPSGSYSIITGDGVHEITPSADSGHVEQYDSFTISGTGWGHNVGMSQWGARGMAEQGYTYDDIITYYFTGVYIA